MWYENLSSLANHGQKQPREVFCKKSVLRNFAKFTGKHLCQSLTCAEACNFIKKRLWHWRFPLNFVKFLRIPLLQNTSGRLLLTIVGQYFTQLSPLHTHTHQNKSFLCPWRKSLFLNDWKLLVWLSMNEWSLADIRR